MAARIYSCTNNSHITISDNWLRTSAVIHIYKARARRNGYRLFISVYILWSCYSKCSVALRHGVECACASEWRSCFSGDNFRTFLDLKTTFWLSFYYFLHCIILFLHCRLSFSKLTLDFGIFNVYQIRAIF